MTFTITPVATDDAHLPSAVSATTEIEAVACVRLRWPQFVAHPYTDTSLSFVLLVWEGAQSLSRARLPVAFVTCDDPTWQPSHYTWMGVDPRPNGAWRPT